MRVLLALLLTAVAACADAPSSQIDGGPMAPLPIPAIPGGGTTGGSIQGRLVIHVLAAGLGLSDVTVAVDAVDGRRQGRTDANGRLEFTDPALRGPVTITAFQTDGPHYTLAGLDATGVSMDFLTDLNTPFAEGAASGEVRGWTMLSGVEDNQFAEVLPVVRNVLSSSRGLVQNERPGETFTANVVKPALPSYLLRLDVTNTVGVYARGGRVPPDGEPPTFEYLALSPELNFTAGATVATNLRFTIPLDRELTVTTENRPDLPFVGLLPVLRLADGGFVALADAVTVADSDIVIRAPTASALPGAEVGGVALARDAVGQQSVRWFDVATDRTPIPPLLALPMPSRAGARAAVANGDNADLQQWLLLQNGQPLWRLDAFGPALRAPVAWPAVLPGFPDPVSGPRVVTVTSFDFGGLDPDRVSFTQLPVVLRGLAIGLSTLIY
ncbi:MAG: hypothetical protein AAF449_14085 [Myxococcota bacterium]